MSNENLSTIDTVAIREAFTAVRDRELLLSDDVLAAVITKAGARWTEMEEDDNAEELLCSFLEKAEKEAAKVSISDVGITRLVAKMDKAFHLAIAENIEAVIKGKNTAVNMYGHFRRTYTMDELNSMAVPGTDKDTVVGNQKPDKVKTKDQTGKIITVTWTNDFVSSMPEGKEYDATLDDISKEVKSIGSVPRLKGKSKAAMAALKSDATQRRNALRSMVKRAISLHFQWEAVREMPKVICEWIPGTKEKHSAIVPQTAGPDSDDINPTLVTIAPRNIWIYPAGPGGGGNGRDFSVTQFLAFDVPAAIAAGGTLADLVETAGRGVAESGQDEDGTGENMTDEDAIATAQAFVTFFGKTENRAGWLKKIVDRKKNAEGNDILELVMELDRYIHPIADKNRATYEQSLKARMLNEDNEVEAATG